MFTGIVEEAGAVIGKECRGEDTLLRIYGPSMLSGAATGASVAVDGVRLTTAEIDRSNGVFAVQVVAETADRTSLGWLRPGDLVNLERAATAGTRLDGHVLVGNADGIGRVLARTGNRRPALRVGLPTDLTRYAVPQGWIALDGVSLPVVAAGDQWITAALSPAVLRTTTLAGKRVGDGVNVEVDVLAKYVERMLAGGMP